MILFTATAAEQAQGGSLWVFALGVFIAFGLTFLGAWGLSTLFRKAG